ncbi:unnamed protein product [Diatraea saccharalis]|uniref:Uncharacterized protein n=1 Tax=Diatraea saccharalis TaxID=40085 RepID=A0A9N9RC67_9NEOP|nr:unnamed protein product [Diatraea saccharalis]
MAAEDPRRSSTSPPKKPRHPDDRDYEERTTEESINKMNELMRLLKKQIYGAMKREVKENIDYVIKNAYDILQELYNGIIRDRKEMKEMREKVRLGERIEEMGEKMREDMDRIARKMEQQQEELIKQREEKERNQEEEESIQTKYLRMIDHKLENIKSREEALFDRFSDRTLKDNEMTTAIITRKLDTLEENLTAETIELGRNLIDRLGRREDKEESSTGRMTEANIVQQIRETGKEITLDITKTIDTVLTECMQDLHNTITYGGTAPEGNTEVLSRMGCLETNIKEEIENTKETITGNIREVTGKIIKTMEGITPQENTTPAEVHGFNTYAETTKGKHHRKPKTMHSLLIASKNKNDMAQDIIDKAKEILKPDKNGIQIERIRKVKDQRIIVSCIEEQETERIKERIEVSEELEAERVKNKDPLIIIKEVKYKLTDEEIKKAIRNQNPDIYATEQEDDNFRIKYRRKTRNTEKCHIIAQLKPEYWKRITEKGHLYIEMERVRVEDQTPLIQCTRCLNFGHGRKFCQESADKCSHCGGLHLRAECPDRKAGVPPQCCNCTHAEIPETDHNAFSTICKTREKWDSLARSTTAYV